MVIEDQEQHRTALISSHLLGTNYSHHNSYQPVVRMPMSSNLQYLNFVFVMSMNSQIHIGQYGDQSWNIFDSIDRFVRGGWRRWSLDLGWMMMTTKLTDILGVRFEYSIEMTIKVDDRDMRHSARCWFSIQHNWIGVNTNVVSLAYLFNRLIAIGINNLNQLVDRHTTT